jgi:hypothetical protein
MRRIDDRRASSRYDDPGRAGVAEQADARVSNTLDRKVVRVRVSSPAPQMVATR